MKALNVAQPVKDSKLILQDYPVPEPEADQVLIRVHYTAMNRADLLQMEGRYPVPKGVTDIPGLEVAGIVEKSGINVKGVETGQAVCTLLDGGGYAEYAVVDHQMIMPVEAPLSLKEAAAIPEVFLTAWQALFWLGRLQSDENVLIHAGASGVGTAAIQLARKIKEANIATTAGSPEKLEICSRLGADVKINYKEEDFSDILDKSWGESSVNFILDFIGAPYWQQNLDLLSMDGRLVMLALLGGARNELSIGKILRKRLTIMGSTLRNRSQDYKRRLTKELYEWAFPLFKSGELNVVIDSEYDWKDAEKARQRMNSNLNAGKIVLRIGEN